MKFRHRRFGGSRLAIGVMLACSAVTLWGAQPPKPAVKGTTGAAVPASVVRMSDALVSAIQALTKDRTESEFLGISEMRDDSHALHVNSFRALIAWQTAKANDGGGRFRPPANDRMDVVTVDCGDADIGDVFECSRVRVISPGKRVVKPFSYTAGPKTYRNAMGAKWTVREVFATYHALDLKEGFSVDYADFGGTEWTLVVSAEDAAEKLLLKVSQPESSK